MKLKIFNHLTFFLFVTVSLSSFSQSETKKDIPASLGAVTSLLEFQNGNTGKWTEMPSGKMKWNAYFSVPDVVLLEQELQRLIVPENCRVRIYCESNKVIYSSRSSDKVVNTVSGLASGSTIRLEYTEMTVPGAVGSERQVKNIRPVENDVKIERN